MKTALNINGLVRAKLTQLGLDELKRQRDELRKTFKNVPEWTPPPTDTEGYATFQLWSLMHSLGPLCMLGGEPPFETVIYVDVEP